MQCGRKEAPGLMHDDGKREDEADSERELQRQKEWISGAEVLELCATEERLNRADEDAEHIERGNEPETDARADEQRGKTPDDAPAQLFEVVKKRHLCRAGAALL